MWNGEERRKFIREDHDVLTRIDVNLSNFMIRFDDHVKGNAEDFMVVKKRLGIVERYIWIAIGGLIVLEFVLKLVAHAIDK